LFEEHFRRIFPLLHKLFTSILPGGVWVGSLSLRGSGFRVQKIEPRMDANERESNERKGDGGRIEKAENQDDA
jgi:hypothetical protein